MVVIVPLLVIIIIVIMKGPCLWYLNIYIAHFRSLIVV